ncbi:hypothetical protein [Aeromonas media]|uniref:hypothetical protein n=1 Tax=Aeromonas media TaxID=651 RepID=UPI0038CFFE7E
MSKNAQQHKLLQTLVQANELIYKLLEHTAELEDSLNQHCGNSFTVCASSAVCR